MFGRTPGDANAVDIAHRASTARAGVGRSVLVATILASSMVFIDGSVVNVVLPVLQADLHANAIELQWIVVGYTLFLSSLMLVGGSLGDHFGRRRIFVSGVVLFATASMLCGVAPTAPLLIVARCVQGIGSAMLTPGSLALIGATFDEKSRGKAIGTWSSVTAVMAALGPGLGGFLAQHASWRWIFYINVPFAIAVVIVAMRGVPESKDRERVHVVDWAGAVACTAGLGAIVYGLTFASTVWVGAGVSALGAFIFIESRARAPLVPLRLFASRTFSGVNALTLFLYGALSGALFFLPFEMIQIDGYTPTAAGFAFLPFVMFIFALSPVAGGLVPKVGARLPLVVGPLLTACGFVVLGLSRGLGSYWTAYLPAIVLMGVGMATAVAPLTTVVMESVDADRMGAASGVNNAISRVAGMLAIATLGALILNVFSGRLAHNMDALAIPAGVRSAVFADRYALAETKAPAGTGAAMSAMVHKAVEPAYVEAFAMTMFACAGLAAAGALIAAFTIGGRPRPGVTPG